MPRINLKKFIAEHYKGGVTARDVIREGVTNSIHAGANKINVDLEFEMQADLIGGDHRFALKSIKINDNGEGFTIENLNHFEEICTGHKDDIGGKGVGRLAFLKFANRVEVKSQIENEFVKFIYSPDFRPDEVERWPSDGSRDTTIILSGLKDKINTQVGLLVNSICDDLRLLMFLKKTSGKSIYIKFTHNSQQHFQDEYIFSSESIEAHKTKQFDLCGEVFNCYLFRDPLPRKGIVAALCADEVCVEEYQISKRFDVCRYLISITSKYLNRSSNIERKALAIPKTGTDADMISPISRDMLMPQIHKVCLEMINEYAENDIIKFKAANVQKLKTFYPFIDREVVNEGAKLLDADEIVKDYRIRQARKEDALVDAIEAGRKVSFDDISHLASDDLARYIVHRALVIDSLSKMPAETAEHTLHDTILRRNSNGCDLKENNVWIIDDKFLSYSSIYSNKALTKIVQDIGVKVAEGGQTKPDIAAFFSQNDEGQPNKLVIVEFKKPGADIFENNKALLQCRLYADELVNKVETILEVFSFSIVEIDNEFYRELKATGYKDVFSLTERVVYNDFSIGENNKIPMHLYVMPSSSLVANARARNRVFEEVLRFNMTGDAGK